MPQAQGIMLQNLDSVLLTLATITNFEEKTNQILDFTKGVKNMPHSDKVKIIEALWKIIYSNNNSDMYEANLMRRLAGLLYIDPKIMGNLKEKVKRELTK